MPMNKQTLRTFCQQLAAWAQTAIDEGNYPYRKVELFPSLLSASGELTPPLVFWINRDSFMAGAVVFFPDNDAEEHLTPEQNCTAALGLDYFVTWGRNEIICWKVEEEKTTRFRTLSARPPAADSPAAYRHLLLQLLGEMQPLSARGLLPAERLSPYYFANLFRTVLTATLPGLRDQLRRKRVGALAPEALPPDAAALRKAVTSLLRLVALVGFDALPASVQPEGLEQAARYALETLPPELHPSLAFSGNELPLTPAAAIRFHHLLRRLTQLRMHCDLARTATALELLLDSYRHQLGGMPHLADSPLAGPGNLLINPTTTISPEPPFFESASPPLLAFFSLIRAFKKMPAATQQFTSPLFVGAAVRPRSICGVLGESRIPPLREHSLLATYLRISWPGRRWVFPPGTPRWAWDLLHLLGLAEPGATIDVTTPGRWLASPFATILCEVCCEHCSLQQVHLSNTAELRFSLTKSVSTHESVLLLTPHGERSLPYKRLRQAPGSILALALALPPNLFPLLAEGHLRPVAAGLSGDQLAGADFFATSTLGQLLTTILSAHGAAIPRGLRFDPQSYPLPDPQLLGQLATDLPERTPPSQETFDQEVNSCPPTPPLVLSTGAELFLPPSKLVNRGKSLSALMELLIQTVFADGIPLFPDHYLFAYLNPETFCIDLPEPLAFAETFFDRATLTAASGRRLDIEGLATARAIVLCSHGRKHQVKLPVDPTIMRAILERYLADLRRLHHTLRQLAHQHLGSARQADNLATRIWKDMHLPPPDLFDS